MMPVGALMGSLLAVPSLQSPVSSPQSWDLGLIVQEAPARKKLEDYRALLENNLFSPPKKATPRREEARPAPRTEPGKPEPPVLTGLVFNRAQGRFEAVVEDRGKKEIRFCTPGDKIEAWTVVSIAADRLIATDGSKEVSIKVGQPVGEGGAEAKAAPAPAVPGEQIEEARRRLRERYGKKPDPLDEEDREEAERPNKKKD